MAEDEGARKERRNIEGQKAVSDAMMDRVRRWFVFNKIKEESFAIWKGERGKFPRSGATSSTDATINSLKCLRSKQAMMPFSLSHA